MPNQLTDFRSHIVTTLTAAFPSAEVKSGRRQGVSRDKDRIAVFYPNPAWTIDPARAVVGRAILLVRYWKKRSELPPNETTWWQEDESELEQALADLLDALRAVQGLTGIAGRRPWYFLIDSGVIDPDPEEWGVEVRLVAPTANEGTIP